MQMHLIGDLSIQYLRVLYNTEYKLIFFFLFTAMKM